MLRHLVRAVSWRPLVVVGLAGPVFVALATDQDAVLLRARVAGIGLGAVAAYVLDDPAASTLASSPTSLATRWAVRLGGGLMVATAGWAAIVLAAAGHVPVRAMSLEVAAYLAVGFAVAALSFRLVSETVGGIVGTVMVGIVATSGLVARVTWWPVPDSPLEPGATRQLVVVVAVALGILALSSRDPARRTLR